MIIIAILLAYLIGSFNSAITVCQLAHLPDLRAIGSGNPGATNMLRVGGKFWAAVVLVTDALKGTIAVLIAKLLGVSVAHQIWIVLVVVLGHMYPLYYRFQGGKGVATAWGGLLGLHWSLGLFYGIFWLAVILWTQYSVIAAIIASWLVTFIIAWQYGSGAFVAALILAGFITYRHNSNLTRLWRGEESKLDLRGKS